MEGHRCREGADGQTTGVRGGRREGREGGREEGYDHSSSSTGKHCVRVYASE